MGAAGTGRRAASSGRPQLPASPRGARPLGEGVASAGSSVPLPRPRPSTWSRQVRPLPGSPGTEGDSLGVLGDNHRKRSSGRSWTGGLLEQTWGFFLEESGDKTRVAGAHRASAWVFLRRKELTDLCRGSPGGRGSEGGALGEEREVAAQHGATQERTWDYGLCPAQWRRLDPPGSGSTGALTPAWGQSAASPSLMGMLMWALSRGVLWPSRSTSTYGEGGHGSRGHSASPPTPRGQHSLVCTSPSAGLGPRRGEPLLCRYPALLGSHLGPCPHSLTLSPALVPTGNLP